MLVLLLLLLLCQHLSVAMARGMLEVCVEQFRRSIRCCRQEKKELGSLSRKDPLSVKCRLGFASWGAIAFFSGAAGERGRCFCAQEQDARWNSSKLARLDAVLSFKWSMRAVVETCDATVH
jgi:hypothetical protein